jgi:hypothetical protein
MCSRLPGAELGGPSVAASGHCGILVCVRSLPLLVITVVLSSFASAEIPAGAWLDSPSFEPWNRAGMSIPSAPQGEKNPDPRCRELARSPESDEDGQVRARGWDLVGRPTEAGQLRVVAATADYDGMCRPRQFQSFVFSHGMFVGTLSPHPMDSRTDGALGRVTIESDQRLKAAYTRYAATDPLCCPSRTTTVVFGIDKDPAVVRPLSATTVSNLAKAPP